MTKGITNRFKCTGGCHTVPKKTKRKTVLNRKQKIIIVKNVHTPL